MRVAVVGGGIFGCTAAIHLARAGHDTHLFEIKNSLLRSASGINQFRLHGGYHYPRAVSTIEECKRSVTSFCQEYGKAVIPTGRHYYAIASGGRSKTDAGKYLGVLQAQGLKYAIASPAYVDGDAVDVVIHADERWIDPVMLRGLVYDKLGQVQVHLGAPADGTLRDEFDKIVIAAYGATNDVCMMLDAGSEPFQFEVCEKPVVKMPKDMNNVGVVIMDGEFCSLDPLGNTGMHVLGHVHHAIHARNVGVEPEIPEEMLGDIDAGLVWEPEVSNWDKMQKASAEFIPALWDAEYMGSMFTVRAVLPEKDATDERPTIVSELDPQVLRIFSGKIGCCVDAAKQVVEWVSKEERAAA